MKKILRFGALASIFAIGGCVSGSGEDGGGAQGSGLQITQNAVGSIRLGMSLPEVKQSLEQGQKLINPQNVQIRKEASENPDSDEERGGPAGLVVHDQFAIVDAAGRTILKFLLADPSKPEIQGNRIVMITALGPQYLTAEGVRPGSSITEAAAIYGAPTLLDDDREGFGREWVAFLNGPGGIRFEAGRSGQDGRLAGIYAASETSTTGYVPGSKIRAIVIGRR